ncbi:hypothetical protein P1P91_09100 [Halomonas piscis]|uniref:Uncharacterized protein n=1 Tax=Halomonas piscis TaxID=3031727 RepID=A0ABY9YVY9_9GAMM|nr:hypothetical protein [Halomonas piscis]WNK19038.1 hypothetical protein P1P91_09100 [Halomonas piscis]
MDWLNENGQAISAITSVVTVFVWIFYAQLLYDGYARQRRPRIIVNRGKGVGLEALCLISNMSTEPIYVQHLIAVLCTRDKSYSLDVVEYQQEGDEEAQGDYRTQQGPLASGDYLHIQSFDLILHQLARYWELDDDILDQEDLKLSIRVVAIYGSEDMPTGAWRSFRVNRTASPVHQLVPETIDTHRMSGKRKRKRVMDWAKEIEIHKVY